MAQIYRSNISSISSTRRNSPIPIHGNANTSVNTTTSDLGLPKEIQRIVAQRIRAFEIAAAEMDAETRRHTTLPLYPRSGEDADEYQHYKELRTAKERQPSVPHKRVTPFEDDLSRDTKKPATPTSNVQTPTTTQEGWIYPTETSQKMTEEPTESTGMIHQTSGPYSLPPDLQEYMGMTIDQNQNVDDIYEHPWIEPTPEITTQDTMNVTPDVEPKQVNPEITNDSQVIITTVQSSEE